MTKKTPAVTIVAACIKADTGVGPSIASGSHICKPNCADLPIAPTNKKKQQTKKKFNLKPIKNILKSKKYEHKLNITLYLTLPKITTINAIAINNAKSPILFTSIAFIAALFANILVYQKLINKYEDNPTPSHPINICTKFSAVTNNNIKNVNNDK